LTLHAAAIAPTFAVKNGPAGMWHALGSTGAGAVGAFLTSLPVLAITASAWLALAVVLYSRARRGRLSGIMLTTTAVAGLLVVVESTTRVTLLGLLVPLLLAGLWIAALWRGGRRGSRSRKRHAGTPDGSAEVVDLARWREQRETRRNTGSR